MNSQPYSHWPHKRVFDVSSLDQLSRLAELLSKQLRGVVYLLGDLGSGKTTLSQFWLKALGVVQSIKSPTYTLVESYELPGQKQGLTALHLDLYRLESPEEFYELGLEYQEYDLMLVEWPLKAAGAISEPDAVIELSFNGQGRSACVYCAKALIG